MSATATLPLADRLIRYPDEAAWLASRQHFLGASEIAAVLGLSTYKDATPFRVWQAKVQPEDVPAMDPTRERNLRRGNRVEAAILGEFGDDHPEFILEPLRYTTVAHPVYERIRCSPDCLLFDRTDEDMPLVGGCDAKFYESYYRQQWGPPGSGDMPYSVIAQGLVTCECLEIPRVIFACWFGRNDYREYPVERNERVAEALIVRALEWWDEYVVPRRYPPLDGSPAAERFIRDLYPKDRLPLLPATDEAVAHAKGSAAARKAKKAAEDAQRFHDTRLRELIGEHEGIEGIATNRQSKDREVTDWQAVAAAALFELREHVGAKAATLVQERLLAAYTTTQPGSRSLRLTYKGET